MYHNEMQSGRGAGLTAATSVITPEYLALSLLMGCGNKGWITT